MGKKISDMVSDLKTTKPTVSKGRKSKADEMASIMESEAFKAAISAAVTAATTPLLAEIATLKAAKPVKGGTSKGHVLDNENYAIPGTFNPVLDQPATLQHGDPNFGFTNGAIPDHCYREVMKGFYGARFWKGTNLWSMARPNYDRFNTDLAAGTFSDYARGVCSKLVEQKGAPRTTHGQAIAAFWMED